VVWNKILFEAKAVEKLTDSHIKQVLNYLAASKLRLGVLVKFGGDSLEWKRLVLSDTRHEFHEFAPTAESEFLNIRDNSCNSCHRPLNSWQLV
jgi:hypothetical protein